jgi:glucan endo-1,3-alpha-glucosidase
MFETYPSINGAFSWAAWPDPMSSASELTSIDDEYYMEYCNDDNKVYLAPVSPWFYTHLSYKNYLYHCDSLWYDRWQQLIFDIQPPMIEIITWNDWGESSYIGTIDPDSADLPSGSPAYVDGFPHTSWLSTLPYFLSYYKTGVAPTVNQDVVVYWYRPFLKASVASKDPYGSPSVLFQNTSVSPYTPAETVADSVFVLTILMSPGTVQVTSGSITVSQSVPAGDNLFSTALYTGYQTITLLRNSNQICSSLGEVSVGTSPVAYNYNAYVSGCQSSSKRKIQITQ